MAALISPELEGDENALSEDGRYEYGDWENVSISISSYVIWLLYKVLHCTIYLTLHSFSLKLCSATIDFKT